MISYNDLDFAIARWKARVGGAPQPAPAPASGMVEAEVPVATAPEGGGLESGAVAEEAKPTFSSGLVMSDGLPEAPLPEGQDPDQK
jgi:hypothetical protein